MEMGKEGTSEQNALQKYSNDELEMEEEEEDVESIAMLSRRVRDEIDRAAALLLSNISLF